MTENQYKRCETQQRLHYGTCKVRIIKQNKPPAERTATVESIGRDTVGALAE